MILNLPKKKRKTESHTKPSQSHVFKFNRAMQKIMQVTSLDREKQKKSTPVFTNKMPS